MRLSQLLGYMCIYMCVCVLKTDVLYIVIASGERFFENNRDKQLRPEPTNQQASNKYKDYGTKMREKQKEIETTECNY